MLILLYRLGLRANCMLWIRNIYVVSSLKYLTRLTISPKHKPFTLLFTSCTKITAKVGDGLNVGLNHFNGPWSGLSLIPSVRSTIHLAFRFGLGAVILQLFNLEHNSYLHPCHVIVSYYCYQFKANFS